MNLQALDHNARGGRARVRKVMLCVVTIIWLCVCALWASSVARPRSFLLGRNAGEKITLEVMNGSVSVGRLWQPSPAPSESSLSSDHKSYLGVVTLQTDRIFDASRGSPVLNSKWRIVRFNVRRLALWGVIPIAGLWWIAISGGMIGRNRVGFGVVQGEATAPGSPKHA